MKKNLTFIALCLFSFFPSNAQNNCGNPIQVTLCSGNYLTGQTNAGKGDDAPAACNIVGEDVCYRVNVPGGAISLYVMINAGGSCKLMVQSDTCGGPGTCTSYVLSGGIQTRTFNISAANYYTVWVDAAATITFSISFGAATSSVYTTIPDTQGSLRLDSSGCAVPIFNPAKPFFQVAYNSVYKTHPMTLSPLFVTGVLKVVVYFKNTTGIEGIKRFTFQFNPYGPGFNSISPAPASIPGIYRPGSWVASGSGSNWTFNFNDAVTPGKGDFNLTPNTCLRYEFNFNVTPVSNTIAYTTVNVSALSDGFGVGFAGWVNSGCCPVNFISCLGASGGNPSTATNSFGFGFADPGALPISLLEFSAEQEEDHILLQWSTATEVNNDFFTVEKSRDGISWTVSDIIAGAGNSTSTKHYKSIDPDPFEGLSYYRLKQTDYNGVSAYFSPVDVFYFLKNEIEIFPNPASDIIEIRNLKSETIIVNIYSGVGKLVFGQEMTSENQKHVIDVSDLARGLYLLVIERTNGDFLKQEKIVLSAQ